jgi:hypothetical protein
MELDVVYGLELIKKAYEKQIDKQLWQMWLAKYPYMDKDTFISFEKFKEGMTDENKSGKPKQTKEQIIAMAEEIKAADQRQRGIENANI